MKIPKEKNLFALSAVTSILSAVATTPTTASLQSYDLTSASLQWKLENCDGKISIPATIPGLVHTDLLSAGFVKENPYYRFNELEQSWISKETCWKYSASFPLEALLDDVPLFLELSGVDTIANITLNNYFLGSTSNAFKTYSYEVQTQYLTGMNELVLTIDSPVSYPQEKADQYPYSVPHTQNYNVWTEPSDRNFIRKAGSDFGWDWGPAYVPSGVTGSISMYQSTMGKFTNLLILQDLSEDFAEVTLTPKLQLQHVSPSAISATVLVYLDNQLIQQSDYDLHSGQKVLQLNSLEITKPTLWYPIGFGSPHLYEFTVKYCPSTAASTAFSTSDCQTQTKKIGIRKMELIREKIGTLNSAKFSHQNSTREGQYQARSLETAAPSPEMAADDLRLYQVEPQTFYFKINGQPIFARGANFIPIDSFQSRVTKADREYILRAALEANMNMIRVWGGGIYQPDDFYAMADEMGLMVWEETMFACALYPRDDEFLENVYSEITEMVWQMSPHPSIVIWGGNNENEVALGWFSESNQNRDLYVGDYLKLYVDTIYRAIGDVEGHTQRPFVDSSPSNGIISSDPYVKQWGTASTPKAGDTHFYDYSSDCESYSMYPDSKFISEFGFQVHPSYLAYEPVTTTEDRSKSSKFVQYRQRHEDGNNQMEYQITRHFTLPMMGDDGCDEEEVSRRGGGWDSYLYLSQIQQSRCYETAINYWRSLRSDLSGGNIPQTMGVLYWQLNDIWEGPSWASMEWGGRWKPLQYSVKRSFAEISLSFLGLPQEDEVKVFGINDRLVDSPVGYSLYLFPWTLSAAAAAAAPSASVSVSSLPDSLEEYLVLSSKATLLAGSSQELEKLSLSSLFATLPALNCSRSTCFLYLKAEQVSSAATSASASMAVPSVSYFPEPFKNLKWTQKPTILTSHFQHISPTTIQFVLEVDMISPFLFIELRGSNVLVENPSGKGVNNVNAGWFSDNNFLALPGVKYEIRYTSFEEISLEMEEWKEKLQIRSLQSVQTESCA